MKIVDVFDLSDDARELVRECEAKGARTVFERNGRPVATLVSYDEYLALRETIEIANDPDLAAMLNAAEEDVQRGELRERSERVRLAPAAESDLNALAQHEQKAVDAILTLIDDDPIVGAPLFDPLKGLWTFRAEHLRIVYRIVAEARFVVVLSITRAAIHSPA